MTWTMTNHLVFGAGYMIAAMAVLWVLQWLISDAAIVDVAWSAGLGFLALFFAVTPSEGDPGRRALLSGLACAWAFRLALHLLNDRIIGKPEDGRYQMMRNRMGDLVQQWFAVFYLLQAGFTVLFAVPLAIVAHSSAAFPQWTDIAAIGVWLLSMLGESLADSQLARFRADPATKGTTCRVGLWRYSRHPNYFFEWLHWWTYVLLAWNTGYGFWVAVVFGPVLMFVFLWYLTGIPYTEMQALRTRSDYAEYQRTTSMFFPWFTRSSTTGAPTP